MYNSISTVSREVKLVLSSVRHLCYPVNRHNVNFSSSSSALFDGFTVPVDSTKSNKRMSIFDIYDEINDCKFKFYELKLFLCTRSGRNENLSLFAHAISQIDSNYIYLLTKSLRSKLQQIRDTANNASRGIGNSRIFSKGTDIYLHDFINFSRELHSSVHPLPQRNSLIDGASSEQYQLLQPLNDKLIMRRRMKLS